MQFLRKTFSLYPLYVVLYPFFFVLHGFIENFYFVSVGSAFLLTAIYCLSFISLTLLFHFFYKRIIPSALLAGFIMTFHFFFGPLIDFLKEYVPDTVFTKYSFIISFFMVLTIILLFLLKKKKNFVVVNQYLNILFAVLILIDAALLVKEVITEKNITRNTLKDSYIACNSCSKPDVYLILLDEYAGEEELKNEFNYDNRPFFDSLSQRGFKTIPHSHSNYNYTPYSTASTLNMEYLDPMQADSLGGNGNKYAQHRINDSKIISFFLANGYRFFNYSVFRVKGQPSPTVGSFVPANTKLITANTFVSRFEKDVLLNLASKYKMRKYLSKLLNAANNDNQKLLGLTMDIAADTLRQPKIVYTHLLMPHHPYYYDEKGNFHVFESVSSLNIGDTAAYLSYLKYTNKIMLRLIDRIVSASATPPLIVLFSDHGYRYINSSRKKDAFSNLISVRLPSKNYDRYPDSLSNVNLFRTLLNNEFKQRLPWLKDQQFFISF